MGVKKNSGRYPMEETEPTAKVISAKEYEVLDELRRTIKDDYIWSMETKTILDNNGLGDIDTRAFLNGIRFATKNYLDILDKLKEE